MIPVIYLPQTPSTNEEILNFIPLHTAGCALYTFNQTKGRGQYGSTWDAFPEQNLAYSTAFPTREVKLSDSFFNYHTACTVRDFLAKMTNCEVKIKWPNDMILKGKKICGILIEKMTVENENYFIIGVGINVNQEDFSQLPKAGSVLTQTGLKFDLQEFAEAFHNYASSEILMKTEEEFILKKFNENLFRKDAISVFEIKGVRQNGMIRSADRDGFLEIELENDGVQRFFHKQIELLY